MIFQLILGLLLAASAPSLLVAEPGSGNTDTSFQVKRIAHAGGGLNGLTYTNSYQALDSNIEKGFEYFEIDFVFTSDGHLVCLHDWKQNFERSFGFAVEQPLSLEAFSKLAAENSKFTNCTLEGLAEWLLENPTASIVTDVKDDNLKALEIISKTVPDHSKRVIPQIYYPRSFSRVRAMGYERIIWTLYRLRITDKQVLSWTAKWPQPIAVTMPKERGQSGLPLLLLERGIPVYVHTVNSTEERDRFLKELAVTEIYTDFLVP